ncbi:hypothetical protein Q3G72_024414 [Acer saccharum]|nr:hypothetical protein Q3G72_024414 [Acer saccharum]
MEVVCGSTAVEPPMSPRSPPGGGLDLYGKGDRWLKFRFWRERLACFRAFLFKGFLSDEECDCVTTLLICLAMRGLYSSVYSCLGSFLDIFAPSLSFFCAFVSAMICGGVFGVY